MPAASCVDRDRTRRGRRPVHRLLARTHIRLAQRLLEPLDFGTTLLGVELGDSGLRNGIPIAGFVRVVRRSQLDDSDFREVVHPIGAHRLETAEDNRVDRASGPRRSIQIVPI